MEQALIAAMEGTDFTPAPEPAEPTPAPEPEPEPTPEPVVDDDDAPGDAGPEIDPELDFLDAVQKGLDEINNPKKSEEEKPAEEPPEEAPDDDSEPDEDLEYKAIVEKMGEKAGATFKRIKGENKDLKTKLSELETAREAAEARIKELDAVRDTAQADALKARVDELERELAVNDFTKTRDYKELVADPMNEHLKKVTKVAAKYGLDENALLDAIAIRDPRKRDDTLEDLLGEAKTFDRDKIFAAAEAVDELLELRETLRAKADTLREEEVTRKANAEKEAIAARVIERETAMKEIWPQIEKNVKAVGLGDELVSAIKAGAEKAPTLVELNPKVAAYTTFASVALPELLKVAAAARKEVADLRAKLDRVKASTPKAGGVATAQAPSADEDRDLVDIIMSELDR